MTQVERLDTFQDADDPGRVLPNAAWVAALIAGCAIVTWRASQGGALIGYEMNSDTLLAPAWVEDVRSHAYAWTGFQLARIPSQFPDLLLQALARAVSPGRFWGIFVYCAAQFTGLVFAAGWIVRLAGGAGYLRAVTTVFAVLAAAVLLESVATPTGVPLMWFQSCSHSGPFILALLAMGATTRLLRLWTWPDAALLFLTTTAAVLSDRLVLVEFVGPAVLAVLALSMVLWRGAPLRAWGAVALALAGALAATGLDGLLYREVDVPIVLSGMGARIGLFAREGSAFLMEHRASMLVGGLLPLAFFALYPVLAARLETDERALEANDVVDLGPVRLERDAALLWSIGAIGFIAISLSTVLLVYVGPSSFRYWNGVALWPLIFAAVAACRLRRVFRAVVGVAVALAAVGLLTAATAHEPRPGPVAWRSELAGCLMAQGRAYGLKAGFGDYWAARQTTFASVGALQVEQMAADGVPRVYGSDAFDLIASPRDPGHAPEFNYILTTGLDEAALRDRYGAPSRTFRCEGAGAATVWVYADAARFTRTALAELTPPAGSYLRQCTAVMAQGELFARCPGAGDAPRFSRLHAANACFSDIGVFDGRVDGDCARPFRRLRKMFTPPKKRPPG